MKLGDFINYETLFLTILIMIMYKYITMKPKSILQKIERVFDKNFTIKDNATNNLKKLTLLYSNTELNIHKKLNDIFTKAKKSGWVEGDAIVLRNNRAVIPLQINYNVLP